MWDRCINIPRTILIEVKVNQVTIMDYQNDYVPYWKVTHLDTIKEEAYWQYIFEEPPYWLQIIEPVMKPVADIEVKEITRYTEK